MGLYKNTFVKNKTIIILLVFYWAFSSGCNFSNNIRNPALVEINQQGDPVVKLEWLSSSQEKYFYIKKINADTKKPKAVKEIIDFSSFDYLYNYVADKAKINNDYYHANPIKNYFKDSKYIYIYRDVYVKEPLFFIAGKANDYEVLGGAYLRVGDQIYWRGEVLKGVDIATFKTFKVMRAHSEWESTIGSDKHYLYAGDTVMDIESAQKKYLMDRAVIKKYFQ